MSSEGEAAPVPKKQRYRKDKPWDTPDVDHWKLEEWKDECGLQRFASGAVEERAMCSWDLPVCIVLRVRRYSPGAFLEESSFATLFPRYP